MDLRRKVVYKPRKKKTATSTKDRAFRKDRGYKEFQEYINKNGIPGLVRVSLGIYISKKETYIHRRNGYSGGC